MSQHESKYKSDGCHEHLVCTCGFEPADQDNWISWKQMSEHFQEQLAKKRTRTRRGVNRRVSITLDLPTISRLKEVAAFTGKSVAGLSALAIEAFVASWEQKEGE